MTKHSDITAIETPAIAYFDLGDLYLSDLNPRQDVAEDEINLLAQSLVACGLIQNLSGLDLSRNCAAPLTAYYAQKENDHGKESYSRI